MTKFNAKLLFQLYGMGQSTFHDYLHAHRAMINELATKRISYTGKLVQCKSSYNASQLKYLIEKVFGDSPEGYIFDGKTLIKQNDSYQTTLPATPPSHC